MKLNTNLIKEVSIFHLQKTSVENLTKMEAISERPILYWNQGYLFSLIESQSETLQSKIIEGSWFIDSLTFAECPKRIDQSFWNGNYSVEVIDVSNFPNFDELIKLVSEKLK